MPASDPVGGCVNVVVDRRGQLGELSYLVPAGLTVSVGDAVGVPFGKGAASGLVVGPGDRSRATREITNVWGRRTTPALIQTAKQLSEDHFTNLALIADRLAPRDGKDAVPLEAGPVRLPSSVQLDLPDVGDRQLLICAPLVEPATVAAAAAARLAARWPVLVLCPTRQAVDSVMSLFPSGAARLEGIRGHDASAWAGFCSGTVPIGVGTRTAALWSAGTPAAVVVFDESHPGHREAHQPHTHAREVAAARTRAEGSPLVIIASSAPTAAGLGCGVKAAVVGGTAAWPALQLVDRGLYPPEDRAVPPPLYRVLRRAQNAGIRPVVVCERRRGPWRCDRCGQRAELPADLPAILARTHGPACSRCGGESFWRAGWDAERVVEQFGEGVDAVEAADLRNLRDRQVVVILDLDRPLRGARLDPHVAGMRLVVDSARAAGRGGQVLAASSDPEDPLWQALFTRRDLLGAARCIWDSAKRSGLPPFGRLVWVRVRQARPPEVDNWPARVFGPARVGDEWEVTAAVAPSELRALRPHIERLRRSHKARIWVE